MLPEIRFSTRAQRDLEEAIEDLWEFSPVLARRFAEAWNRRIEQILRFPESGRRERGTRRSVLVDLSGYRLIYVYDGKLLQIIGLKNMRRERRR